jgi:hypothetical protein
LLAVDGAPLIHPTVEQPGFCGAGFDERLQFSQSPERFCAKSSHCWMNLHKKIVELKVGWISEASSTKTLKSDELKPVISKRRPSLAVDGAPLIHPTVEQPGCCRSGFVRTTAIRLPLTINELDDC